MGFLLASMNMGCMFKGKKRNEWKPVEPDLSPLVHEVQWPEETLSTIAQWYTGDDKNRKALADANPNIKPDFLTVGNRIFIPGDLVKKRKPMPREFLTRLQQKQERKKTVSQKKAPPQKEDDIEFQVFGPK